MAYSDFFHPCYLLFFSTHAFFALAILFVSHFPLPHFHSLPLIVVCRSIKLKFHGTVFRVTFSWVVTSSRGCHEDATRETASWNIRISFRNKMWRGKISRSSMWRSCRKIIKCYKSVWSTVRNRESWWRRIRLCGVEFFTRFHATPSARPPHTRTCSIFV